MSLNWIKFPCTLLEQSGIFRLLDADRKELCRFPYIGDLKSWDRAHELAEVVMNFLNIPMRDMEEGKFPWETHKDKETVADDVLKGREEYKAIGGVSAEPSLNSSGNGDSKESVKEMVQGIVNPLKRKGNPAFLKGSKNPYQDIINRNKKKEV